MYCNLKQVIIQLKMYKRLNPIEHRNGTIRLYESQLEDAGEFMTFILKEAIRKLKETELSTHKIEKWVIKLEKTYMKI